MQKRIKILIIEDDASLAGTIKNFLTIKGFEVFIADNGATGIQMAFSTTPDAIVCDINIPVVDGYQVYNILNETPATYSTPFIFLTAKTSLKDIRTGMQLGADDYITKPFEFDDLFNTINTRIQKRNKILRANQERFNSLLNNSPHGAFVCQENRFIEVNKNLAQYFGYSQVEMQKTSLIELAAQADKSKIKQAFSNCITSKQKEFTLEFKGVNKFGKAIPLKLIGGYSFYKGKDCIVGNIVKLDNAQYTLKGIDLSNDDLRELGRAIELFSQDYNLISKDLVEKLSNIYTKEQKEPPPVLVELSEREKEVLAEICKGKSSSEIADTLFISNRTVEKHRAAIVQKTESKNMVEAVIFAIKNGIIIP